MTLRKGGTWCAATNCSNSWRSHKEISFFRFPADPNRSKLWVILIGRKDLMDKSVDYLYKNCRLCSNHFEPCMFTSAVTRRLMKMAEPSIFDVSDSPRQVTCKRKAPTERHEIPNKRIPIAASESNSPLPCQIKVEPEDVDT